MDLQLNGKNALITGSSQGIGLAIATLLHSEGCNITLNGRNSKALENAYTLFPDRVYSCIADVRKHDDSKKLVQSSIDKWGSIDILVCNVGNGTSVTPGNENLKEWEQVFQNNFYSATNIIENVLEKKLDFFEHFGF